MQRNKLHRAKQQKTDLLPSISSCTLFDFSSIKTSIFHYKAFVYNSAIVYNSADIDERQGGRNQLEKQFLKHPDSWHPATIVPDSET